MRGLVLLELSMVTIISVGICNYEAIAQEPDQGSSWREIIKAPPPPARAPRTDLSDENHDSSPIMNTWLEALSENWHPSRFSDNAVLIVRVNLHGRVIDVQYVGKNKNSDEVKQLISSIRQTIFPITSVNKTKLGRSPSSRVGVPLQIDSHAAEQCLLQFQKHSEQRAKLLKALP